MLVRARWQTRTALTFTPTTPHIAQSLTAAVKSEVHVRTVSSLPSISSLLKAGSILALRDPATA